MKGIILLKNLALSALISYFYGMLNVTVQLDTKQDLMFKILLCVYIGLKIVTEIKQSEK